MVLIAVNCGDTAKQILDNTTICQFRETARAREIWYY